jgi:hypothetical protein
MFAQVNPDPDTAWNVILTIGLVLNMLVAGLAVANSRKSQRREVSFGFEPASKENFDRLVEDNEVEHRDMFARIGGVDRGNSAKISQEITLVHNRVNALEKSVGGLEMSAELTNQRLSQIDSKIDRLIERRP